MQLTKTRVAASKNVFERSSIIEDIRKAEEEWLIAQSQFQDALGFDHVDYAIYCLEAAEKKLDMLLRKAKWQWNENDAFRESREMA